MGQSSGRRETMAPVLGLAQSGFWACLQLIFHLQLNICSGVPGQPTRAMPLPDLMSILRRDVLC